MYEGRCILFTMDLLSSFSPVSRKTKPHTIFRSTPPSRPHNISGSQMSVCTSYVHPSTRSFFDFNEIWYVGRGRRVMHDGMQYDPIQGQGHEPSRNSAIFKGQRLTEVHLGCGLLMWYSVCGG